MLVDLSQALGSYFHEVFVVNLEEAVRIRTDERGDAAI